MELAASIAAQVERDEQVRAALYARQAEALSRQRVAEEELARATANLQAAALDVETANTMLASHLGLIARQNTRRAPVLRLPHELLVLVFLEHDAGGPRLTATPFIFARVCRAWRDVALRAPMVWTYMELDLTGTLPNASEYVETILQRSQRLPLSIVLRAHDKVDPNAMRILEHVLPNAILRARDLKLFTSPNDYRRPEIELDKSILKFLQLPTPHLRRLHVSLCCTNLEGASLLPSAPKLEGITLLSRFPLRNLVESSLRNLLEFQSYCVSDPDDFITLGAAAPNLQSMDIHAIFDTAAAGSLPLLNLHRMRVRHVRLLSFPHWLDCFPAVVDLRITLRDTPVPAQITNMPRLRILQFDHSGAWPSNWSCAISLLRRLPQIETLILHGEDDTNAFWLEWAMPINIELLVPRLHSLVIRDAEFQAEDEVTLFMAFLEARATVQVESNPIKLERLVLQDTAFPRWLAPRLEACVGAVEIDGQAV
ncbi:hypothetical protein EXIGLDRAFT_838671 [Exidia glandulosa HHB12029]|uniref:Uncharacterized protein n=1 Tax=Exidia glandulosa HHB12029 TaxID=1314781 RepID=A0A165FLJ4_EXIGL|nr:hypothetical protein EXIGLDRAFT_838671 [Exidia glandulosa HHB12029]